MCYKAYRVDTASLFRHDTYFIILCLTHRPTNNLQYVLFLYQARRRGLGHECKILKQKV